MQSYQLTLVRRTLQELDDETKNSDPEVVEQQMLLAAVIKDKKKK